MIDDDGRYQVLKDDDALLRQPGSEVRTERFGDGSTRATVTREDGTRIVTIRDSAGRAQRRVRIEPDGREYLLIDDTRSFEPVVLRNLPRPTYEDVSYQGATDRESLRAALLAAERYDIGRSFSLRQVRDHAEVRALDRLERVPLPMAYPLRRLTQVVAPVSLMRQRSESDNETPFRQWRE
ncbi:MAG: hypothetical protein JJU40_01635 [Rhodobacteraceae bacterium]|nr:hypothetical protein [Paracoccaceae bacterium]